MLAGGKPRPDLGPLFYEPTVLTASPTRWPCAATRPSGRSWRLPGAPTWTRRSRGPTTPSYGLNASVWTAATAAARAVATRIQAGTVNVNEGYAAAWASHDAPMGGMKVSGVGRRHGPEGMLKYTEAQTVAVQRGIPVGPDPGAGAGALRDS